MPTTLVVLVYRDDTSAAAAGEQAQRLVRYLGIGPGAIATVRRDGDGRFHLTTNHHPAAGELSWGMVWMLAFALLFGAPAADRRQDAGSGTGSGSGTDSGIDGLLELIADSGVDQRFQSDLRGRLAPGTSALFLALGDGRSDLVVEVLGQYGGEVLQTTTTAARLAALREALHGGRAPDSRPEMAVSAGRDRAPGSG
jgi:uncharacterized membrane protein